MKPEYKQTEFEVSPEEWSIIDMFASIRHVKTSFSATDRIKLLTKESSPPF